MADHVLRDCDLIMKGGVTSGVVYPRAIEVLSEKYRLCSVGGTSAGAIAAVVAVAAEYRRARGKDDAERAAGFQAIGALPSELSGERLLRLFQPAPTLARLFRVVVRFYGRNKDRPGLLSALAIVLSEDIVVAVLAAVAALLVGIWMATGTIGTWPGIWLLTVLAVATVAVAGYRLYRDVTVHLRKADFGVCPGIRTTKTLTRWKSGEKTAARPGETADPAFGEWMHETIQRIAGLPPDQVLTVGDLATAYGEDAESRRRGIRVAAMTTDVTTQRPYQLPLQAGIHWFEEAEFRKILPKEIVDYLTTSEVETRQTIIKGSPGVPDKPVTLYRLKSGDDFPVFLVARMSLSFPGLISAVPLYRQVAEDQFERCLFTDGGVSSNFPVHFFDSTLPRRPTFGISLGTVTDEKAGDDPATRVVLPKPPVYPDWQQPAAFPDSDLPARGIYSIGGFGFALLDCAKDWQDTLQSRLPGFNERIVRIRLADDEGGLNLNMDRATVDRLAGYGQRAGELLTGFDFDAHRRLRALTAGAMLKESGASVDRAFREGPPDRPLGDLFREDFPQAPDDFSAWWKTHLPGFASGFVTLAGGLPDRAADLPHADAAMRVVAKPDLTLRPDGNAKGP